MHQGIRRFLTWTLVLTLVHPLFAQKPASSAAPPKIDACSLLAPAEIKKYLPWPAMLDRLAAEREDIGTSGSACNYPTLYLQVFPYTSSFFDTAKKARKQDPVSGVGDEAYISHNPAGYAELLAKVGPRIVTLQASVPSDGTYESVKPKTIDLAKALAAKLR